MLNLSSSGCDPLRTLPEKMNAAQKWALLNHPVGGGEERFRHLECPVPWRSWRLKSSPIWSAVERKLLRVVTFRGPQPFTQRPPTRSLRQPEPAVQWASSGRVLSRL